MAGSGASCSGMLLRRRRAGEAGIGGFLLAVFACGGEVLVNLRLRVYHEIEGSFAPMSLFFSASRCRV